MAILTVNWSEVVCSDRRIRKYPSDLNLKLAMLFNGYDPDPTRWILPTRSPLYSYHFQVIDPELQDYNGRETSQFIVWWPNLDIEAAKRIIPDVMAYQRSTDRYSFDKAYLNLRAGIVDPDSFIVRAHKEGQPGGRIVRTYQGADLPIRARMLRGSKHGWEGLAVGGRLTFRNASAPALINSFKRWAAVRELVGARVRTSVADDGAVTVERIG